MMDWQTIVILSLFRAVLGLAIGVALGNAVRDSSSRKIIQGALGLGQAIIYVVLVAIMHLSIPQSDEHPFIYWGVFAVAVLAGALKTNGVLKTLRLALYLIFGGTFFLFGFALIAGGVRAGFDVLTLIIGGVLVLIGVVVLALLAIPYFKRDSSLGA